MIYERMEQIQEDLFAQIREIRETKGREYATDQDTLADFKEVAEEVGSTPLQTWATYCKKHQRAIDTFIREGGVKSESIQSRILDVVTYHVLLLGLIEDLRPDQAVVGVALHDAEPGESLRIQLEGRIEDNLQERAAAMAPRSDDDVPF